MTIINLGTYPPKQCGIATFSMDLCNGLKKQGENVQIIAVSDDNYKYKYPDEVVFNLRQNQKQDYIKAAAFINSSPDIQVIVVQHEYGIYGGNDGEYILELSKLLQKPYIVISHTVLPSPSRSQKMVLNHLCQRAAAVIGMTRRSCNLLNDLYETPAELLHHIAHGVPEFKSDDSQVLKKSYGLANKEIISTFGLIGPGKGIELGLQAVAKVAVDFPDICYLILGQTHPMLEQGERYRQMLTDLVKKLGIEENVKFVNKYLSEIELGDYLYLTDIYLSPYPNMDQAVSGTMTFAMGCGRAIVSTPYSYAQEVLKGGRGLLSKKADADELANLIKDVLKDPLLKKKLQTNTYTLGKTWTWSSIAGQYSELFSQILNEQFLEEGSSLTYAKL